MPVLARANANAGKQFLWLGALALVVACSGSDKIDFFDPDDEATGGSTGGSAATVGGTDSGGTSGGGTTSTGGASGDTTGGTTGANGGTAGDAGGSANLGGTDPGAGMGGTPTGGANQGGDAGSAMGGDAGGGMGGTAGGGAGGADNAGMGGAGISGAGMGGAGMGGAGMGGAGVAGVAGVAGAGGCTPTSPSTERCDGVDNNCMGGVDEGNACPDNCTGATRAGHYYIFCSFENTSGGMRLRTWTQVQDFCSMRNVGMVFIESAEENAFILDWITRMQLEDQVWIGANDRDAVLGRSNEGTWVWGSGNNAVEFWDGDENGNPVMNRYEAWAQGEPNNMGNEDCGVFSAQHDYAWDDRLCTNTYPNFVCESGASITPN